MGERGGVAVAGGEALRLVAQAAALGEVLDERLLELQLRQQARPASVVAFAE